MQTFAALQAGRVRPAQADGSARRMLHSASVTPPASPACDTSPCNHRQNRRLQGLVSFLAECSSLSAQGLSGKVPASSANLAEKARGGTPGDVDFLNSIKILSAWRGVCCVSGIGASAPMFEGLRQMRSALIFLVLLFAPGGIAQGEPVPVAGTAPDRRPEGAPRIENFERNASWWTQFNHGISQPLPPNLGGGNQGAWYTPFNRPGAPPPYDLRGWHASAPRSQ